MLNFCSAEAAWQHKDNTFLIGVFSSLLLVHLSAKDIVFVI